MEIFGNRKNLDFFYEASKNNCLSHAFILNGPKGSGKKTFAANAACALLCDNLKTSKAFAPCGRCAACTRSLNGSHPDIITVSHEKENVISVDDIRSSLIADTNIKPYYGPYKIYLVPDADLMTVQAQNALLKTFEEPPGYAVIFLLSDNADYFLDTIKSRSIRLDMEPLEYGFIKETLIKSGADKIRAARAAAFSAGSLGQALEISESEELSSLLDFITDLLSGISQKNAADISDAAKTLSEASGLKITDCLRKWYRDVLVLKACRRGTLYFPDKKDILLAQAENTGYEKLGSIFSDIDEAEERLYFNVNSRAVYEALLLRIRHND